jgi:hypothetical protein
VVLEPVQVLVTFLADIALVRLLLFHAHCPRIGGLGIRVDNGECPVSIFMQSLIVMSMLFPS